MAGKHSASGSGRLVRELLRFGLLFLAFVVVLLSSAWWVSRQLEGGDAIPVQATQETNTTTSVLSATVVTQPSTTTTAAAPTTTATTAPSTTTTTLPPLVAPEELTVIVLNSTTVKGMAGRLNNRIIEFGYQVLEPDNFSPALEVSRVWFTEGFDREAAILGELIPDAIVEPYPDDDAQSDITVVLGASFEE